MWERAERRPRPTAARAPAAAQVQDTLTTAWHAAPSLADLDWPTLGSVLALVLATSLLTAWLSHLLNPVQRQMGTARAPRPRAPRRCVAPARARAAREPPASSACMRKARCRSAPCAPWNRRPQ